jgi:hypothetical protein
MFLQNWIPFIFVEVFTFAIKIVPIISPKSIDVIAILIVGKSMVGGPVFVVDYVIVS